jgi:HicB-like protein involved in pilus formation
MSTLTIRIPESKHMRLRTLAKAKGISVNRLIDELATVALTEYDSETRFRTMAARGSRRVGLALLDKLDRAFAANSHRPRGLNRR